MNKLDKIAFIMPRGAVYRYKTGAFGKLIRYAPLTLPALVSLIPKEMNIECEVYDEGIEVVDEIASVRTDYNDKPLDLKVCHRRLVVVIGYPYKLAFVEFVLAQILTAAVARIAPVRLAVGTA